MLIDELELRLSVLAAALLLLLSSAAPALAGDAAKGKATFISICSSCHGLDGIATLDYAPSFAKCPETRQGRLGALGFGTRRYRRPNATLGRTYLTDREILDALAYARTFCKGREHDGLQTPRNIKSKGRLSCTRVDIRTSER